MTWTQTGIVTLAANGNVRIWDRETGDQIGSEVSQHALLHIRRSLRRDRPVFPGTRYGPKSHTDDVPVIGLSSARYVRATVLSLPAMG